MHPVAALFTSVLSAYIIGSFPTSYIITRVIKGVDIRKSGSGNAGATNVLRTVGKIPAIITLVIDIAKGYFAVVFLSGFFYRYNIDLDYDFYRGLLGLVAVCGHIWPVFLKFRGGKGVATTLGVGIAIAPGVLTIAVMLWIGVFFLSNYVSLASIIALIAFPVISVIMGLPIYTIIFGTLICSISIYKHKENIQRLLKGQENKTKPFSKKA